jgi:hypothetical protein
MRRFSSPVRVGRLVVVRLLIACCLLVLAAAPAFAQSTFGEILGTVHDSSGAVVQGAQVLLSNTGTNATRTAVTDGNGTYAFQNIDVGTYTLTISAPGFEKESLPAIALTARETRRLDAASSPAQKPRPSSSLKTRRPSSPPTFPASPRPRPATSWSSCPSPSTPAPPAPPAPSPRSPPRPACRPTTAATRRRRHHRRAAQRHHRRHLLGRRRVLRPRQRDVSLLQLHRRDPRLRVQQLRRVRRRRRHHHRLQSRHQSLPRRRI